MNAWEGGRWAIAVTTTTTMSVNVRAAASWPHMGGYRRLKGSTSSEMRRCRSATCVLLLLDRTATGSGSQ